MIARNVLRQNSRDAGSSSVRDTINEKRTMLKRTLHGMAIFLEQGIRGMNVAPESENSISATNRISKRFHQTFYSCRWDFLSKSRLWFRSSGSPILFSSLGFSETGLSKKCFVSFRSNTRCFRRAATVVSLSLNWRFAAVPLRAFQSLPRKTPMHCCPRVSLNAAGPRCASPGPTRTGPRLRTRG